MSIDDQMLAAILRVEAKLDKLLAALAEDEDEEEAPNTSLDGTTFPGERDQTQSL
jgi:hypothetical protein